MNKAQTTYRFTAMNEGTPLYDHHEVNYVDKKNMFFRLKSNIRFFTANLMNKVNGFSWYLQNFLWDRQNRINRSFQNHE